MVSIFGKFFLRGRSIGLSMLNKRLKSELMEIRHEFEEHLQAINENTNEIAANYEYACELERKIDRLSERVDEFQMHIGVNPGVYIAGKKDFDVKRLNRKEQQVFLIIYTLEEEKGSLTYDDIAEKLGISEQLAASYITSLIEKGVPIIKRYINTKPHFKLDPDFKTLQAKENILQLSLEEFGF